jgi:hypothetical protein
MKAKNLKPKAGVKLAYKGVGPEKWTMGKNAGIIAGPPQEFNAKNIDDFNF